MKKVLLMVLVMMVMVSCIRRYEVPMTVSVTGDHNVV